MARPKIKSATDQRPFIMVYHDFLDSDVIGSHEKMVFIALKKFADSKNQCFPSLKKLSDVTTLLQKVGDNMTQESSSQGLISTLEGFKMEADEASKVVDVVNEVANTEPIDTAGIFDGLTRSASSMKAANNTFEETVALITAAKLYWLNVW